MVYATDARVEPRVKSAFAFPPDSHPPIVYPAAVTSGSAHRLDAESLLLHCRSAEGQAIFRAAGFSAAPPSE